MRIGEEMKTTRTRKKLFITCILFMSIFMILFVIALQVVTETALFEAYSEAEIKEMQQIYDVYADSRYYYEESLALFSTTKYFNQLVIKTLFDVTYASDEQKKLSAERLGNEVSDYISRMDICVVDRNKIIYMYTEGETPYVDIKNHNEENIEFVKDEDAFSFLVENGLYESNNLYESNHIIVEKIQHTADIYIIGIPRYDKIFNFCNSEIVIYNKYEQEELRLNTELIEQIIPTSSINKGKNYKAFGFFGNRYILCYYSNEDERGDYCMGIFRDLSLTFRRIIYLCLILFFVIIGVVLWFWSEIVTKPLDFFLMWMKLIKDKGEVNEDEKVSMPMPKDNYPLQSNIMLFFSFCLIPIIFAGALQWYAENQILNGYVEERYAESAEFFGDILDEKYYIWRDPIILLSNDERIVSSLEEYQEREDIDFDKIFIQNIREYSRVVSDESDILTIYNADGNVVVSSVNEFEDDRYIQYRVNVDEDYKWSFAEGLEKFVLHQKIYNDEGKIVGYCKLELNDPALYANAIYNSEYLYSCYIYKYTDKIYNLFGSPNFSDEKIVNIIRSNEENPLAKSMLLEKANVNYFYIVKEKIFFDRIWGKYVIYFMNIVFFLSITLVFAAGILTRTTLNPIIHISNSLYTDSPQVPMSTLLLGKEEFALIVNRVKTLAAQLDSYAKEQKLLEQEKHEQEKRRKDAEMLTLQTQINPHFMYNIFSSIAVLIRTGQTEKATKMVMHTGNLMRLGLYRGHVLIPLKEEMEHVCQYVNIQQIRYINCVEVDIDIDEALLQFKVVKFILQPIVENAIEHNVGYLESRDLKIQINAFQKDNQLLIHIIDNGRGIEEEKIKKLQESINNFDMSNHLGLANINERIKLNCGQEYGVILSNNIGYGMKVELILPIVIEKEE